MFTLFLIFQYAVKNPDSIEDRDRAIVLNKSFTPAYESKAWAFASLGCKEMVLSRWSAIYMSTIHEERVIKKRRIIQMAKDLDKG